MSKFMEGLIKEDNKAFTKKGGGALKSTLSNTLDLFSRYSSYRTMDKEYIRRAVARSYSENKELTLKMVFFGRDIKQGLGERRASRIALDYIADVDPDIASKNLIHLPEFGRWDDVWYMINSKARDAALDIIVDQFKEDFENMKNNKSVSLLAKWMYKPNHRNPERKAEAQLVARRLGMSDKELRKAITALRQHLNIVETKISTKDFESIDYSTVPSRAMLIYRSIFSEEDEDRFENYLEEVKSGNKKINTSTLTPFDIVSQYLEYSGYNWNYEVKDKNETLEELWKNLPDIKGGISNTLVVADTSTSMVMDNHNLNITTAAPIKTSLSLAIYFAERNDGLFKNKFITFSTEPKLQHLQGSTLYEKLNSMEIIYETTNLAAVFRLILTTAIDNELPQKEMPKSIIIVSDGEFDEMVESEASSGEFDGTEHDKYKAMFNDFGYELPEVVYWNVASEESNFQVDKTESGVTLLSGKNPVIYEKVMNLEEVNPYEVMLEILLSDRYKDIKI